MKSIQENIGTHLITTAIAIIVGYYFFPHWVLLVLGTAFIISCILISKLSEINEWIWERSSQLLQKVFTPIFFGFVYLFILTPIALFYRLFSKQKPPVNSTFVEMDQSYNGDFFKPPW
jgi:hypothetical protein